MKSSDCYLLYPLRPLLFTLLLIIFTMLWTDFDTMNAFKLLSWNQDGVYCVSSGGNCVSSGHANFKLPFVSSKTMGASLFIY